MLCVYNDMLLSCYESKTFPHLHQKIPNERELLIPSRFSNICPHSGNPKIQQSSFFSAVQPDFSGILQFSASFLRWLLLSLVLAKADNNTGYRYCDLAWVSPLLHVPKSDTFIRHTQKAFERFILPMLESIFTCFIRSVHFIFCNSSDSCYFPTYK